MAHWAHRLEEEAAAMWNTLYVYGDHAYRSRRSLWEHEHVEPGDADRCRTFDLRPRYVYRVEAEDFLRYTTDPVDVRRWLKSHPDAEVTVIPVT